MKKIIAFALLFVMIATLFVSCTNEPAKTHEDVINVESVALDKASVDMKPGSSVKLTATVKPENATDKSVTWTSSNDKVVVVNEGNLIAIQNGEASVVVTTVDGSKKAVCKVVVSNSTKVELTGIALDITSKELEVGNTLKLNVVPTPANATLGELTWSSSNKKAVTVSDGNVTAIAVGTSTITCKCGDFTATCEIEVKAKADPTKVSGVTLDITSKNIISGSTVVIKETVTPATASNKKVYWTTSDSNVLLILDNGVFLGKDAGTAIITCTTEDGNYKATCTVKVVADTDTKVNSVTLSQAVLSLDAGKSATIKATVWPTSALNKNVVWSSSDNSIATVDQNGLITGVKGGKALITVTTEEGGYSVQCEVTVAGGSDPAEIEATTLSISASSKVVNVGDTFKLTATYTPANATIKWESGNPTVAKVDANGNVTTLSDGIVIIKAVSGSKSAMCSVNVKKNTALITSITLPDSQVRLDKAGSIYTLNPTILPSGATETLKYSSSNTAVAQVTTNGVVTALTEGSTMITVKSESGAATATCVILVGETATVVNVTGVTVPETTKELVVGNTYTIVPTVLPANATNKGVTYISSNEAVVKVDANGKITGVKAGNATITVKSVDGEKTATVAVSVLNKDGTLTNFSTDKLVYNIYVGDKAQINLTPIPVNASFEDYNLEFSAGSGKVIVNNAGLVTGVSVGEVKVTIYAWSKADNSLAAFNIVTIRVSQKASTVTLNQTKASMLTGEKITLEATVGPADASDKSVVWSTSNALSATVTSSGVVTAGSVPGTAVITATSKTNPNAKASCTITVAAAVTSVTLDQTAVGLKVNETVTLVPTVTPGGATNKALTWTSSDDTVATVDSTGKVTAKANGTATIKATSVSNPDKYGECLVTVSVDAGSVTLDITSIDTLKIGDTQQLTATVLPEEATDKTVTWTSSDDTVATVSESGLVTIMGSGTATITATTATNFAATCTITVKIPVTKVEVNKATDTLVLGNDKFAIYYASVTPDNATVTTVVWSSSDDTIATVDQNGKVTPVSGGVVTIKATAQDDETLFDSITITVVAEVNSISLNNTALNLTEGETANLTVTVLPDTATDKSVTWVSTNSSVADVDTNGKVTAVSAGNAQIICMANSGAKPSATCSVTVTASGIIPPLTEEENMVE